MAMTAAPLRPPGLRSAVLAALSPAGRSTRPALPWRPAARHGEWAVATLTIGGAAMLAWSVLAPAGHRPADADRPQAVATAARAPAVTRPDGRTGGGGEVQALRDGPAGGASSADSVTRSGAAVTFDLVSVSPARAVELLARATRSTVHGADALADRSEPVTLRTTAGSDVEAWRLLLGDELNAAVACSRAGCEVWIVGAMHPGRRPSPTTLPASPAAFEARRGGEAPALQPAAEPLQSGPSLASLSTMPAAEAEAAAGPAAAATPDSEN